MALVPDQLGLQSKTFEREEEGREREGERGRDRDRDHPPGHVLLVRVIEAENSPFSSVALGTE